MSSEEKKRGRGNPNFYKGMKSANPDGRPVGTTNTLKRSRLRTTENKLNALTPEALTVIEKSLRGEENDKDKVSTAKWIIQSVVTTNKAALAEEITINGLSKGKEEMEQAQSEDSAPRFTMDFVSDSEVPYDLNNLPDKGTLQ